MAATTEQNRTRKPENQRTREPDEPDEPETPVFEEVDQDSIKEPAMDFVEKMPEYPGGMEEMMKYLNKNIDYTISEKTQEVCSRIYYSFVVEKDGRVTEVKVIRGCANLELEAHVKKVIEKMPKWTPGEQAGKKVRTRFRIPVLINWK